MFVHSIKNKIITIDFFEKNLTFFQKSAVPIVFTNGCFDIIHRGHVEYLHKAATYGKTFVIGLNTDESVRKIKGENRPVNDEYSRAIVLAAFGFVDFVVLFEEETPYNLIKSIAPDVLVKGSDYKPEEIVGYDIVSSKGGKIVTIDFIPGFSTTDTIKKISEQ